jgi:hypothetical protein
LYEIVARKQPYIDLDVDPLAVASAVVLGRARPAVPEWTPQPLHSLMDQCWHQSLAERPAFPLILERLQRIAGDQSLIHEDADAQQVRIHVCRYCVSFDKSVCCVMVANGDRKQTTVAPPAARTEIAIVSCDVATSIDT